MILNIKHRTLNIDILMGYDGHRWHLLAHHLPTGYHRDRRSIIHENYNDDGKIL